MINDLIDKAIKTLFPNYKDKLLLRYCIYGILQAIKTYFCNNDEKELLTSLMQNNNQDIKLLLVSIFYYLEPENYKNLRNFQSFFESRNNKLTTNLLFEFYPTIFKNNNPVFLEKIKINIPNNYYLYNIQKLMIISIRKMAYKLYINWINIQPISFDELKNLEFYNNSVKKYNDPNELYTDDILDITNSSLNVSNLNNDIYIGEIYNVIRNFLYEKGKLYKLLLFFFIKDNSIVNYIDVLERYISHKTFKEKFNFLFLSNLNKNKFRKFCTYLYNLKYTEKNTFNEVDMKLYFAGYYFLSIPITKINEKERNTYKNIKSLIDSYEDEDENRRSVFIKNLPDNILNIIYEKYILNDEYIGDFYKFLQLQIIGYYSTIYSDNYLPYTKKIFYNYFKSICIDKTTSGTKNELVLLSNNWEQLSSKHKQDFIDFINTKNINFNISRIEKKSKNLIRKNEIVEFINNNLIDIVFKVLIKEGLLSKFVNNKKCVDKRLYKQKELQKNLKKYVFTPKNINNFNKCYYYLNNESYKNLKTPDYDLKKNVSYYEVLYTPKFRVSHYSFFAMNWIMQISIFFKYMNCRILYVTGGTGVGKSSQFPKLMLYALKAFDFKVDGKIICTQPRIDPTVAISERMANELGVPIVGYINNNKVVEYLPNYNIQYQYKQDKIVDQSPYFLRFSTDGLFYNTLLDNIVLKQKTEVTLKSKNKKENRYKYKNVYDMIIVDEAHEHNKNMDYILTLMRNSLYYNNDLKLVIISATMDEDEPIYRYYFKHINDNFKFPLDRTVLDEKFNLTRFLIDRRVHIAVPGELGTQFSVSDNYEDDNLDYASAEKAAIKRTQIICNETTYGHILLFTTGQREIKNISEELDRTLPKNIFIFPYFSEMPNGEKFRDDVKKIHSIIGNYKYDRTEFIKFMFTPGKTESQIPLSDQNSYRRAVVIATNVAEASLTIPELYYVIDIGYYNFVGYDYENNVDIIEKKPIDDNSRKQRRGRTGRTNPGHVYYMYKKGGRSGIYKQKDIESSNITYDILKLMSNKSKNNPELLFMEKEYDPYYCKLLNSNISVNDLLRYYKKRSGYDKIIERQFLLDNKLINDRNIEFREMYFEKQHFRTKLDIIINNLKSDCNIFYSYYETGFDFDDLKDNDGKLFIIHPNENNIRRINNYIIRFFRLNETSEFIKFNNNPNKQIFKFKKMKIIFDNLLTSNFIIPEKINIKQYKKSRLTEYFNSVISSNLSFESKYSSEKITLFYLLSSFFDIEKEFLVLSSFLMSIDFNFRNTLDTFIDEKGKQVFKIDYLKKNQNYNSELIYLYNLANNILKDVSFIINDLLITNNFKIDNLFNFKSNQIEIQSNKQMELLIEQLSKKLSKNIFNISFQERSKFQITSKNLLSINRNKYDYNIKNIKSLIKKGLLEKKVDRIINNVANKYCIQKRYINSFIKNYVNNIIVHNYDEKLKNNLEDLKDIIRLKIDIKTSLLNSFYLILRKNITFDQNNKKVTRTNYGFKNIDIYGNNEFFFLSKRFNNFTNKFDFSLNNIMNFNIIDILSKLKKIDN